MNVHNLRELFIGNLWRIHFLENQPEAAATAEVEATFRALVF